MMKTLNKLLGLAIFGGLLLTGCNNDDDGDGTGPTGPDTTLSGTITEDRVLDPSELYTISGSVLVADGVTLTILAGTELVSEVGTGNFLAVLKGGSIDIEGTPSNPVVMRGNGNAGSWGGLLLCGDATTTEGENAIAEVGGLIYGGSNDADSSGSIEYLIISDAGAQINADSQYNGLSLYGVGSGTSIDNVALVNGADDGVEFFGGTVSASNLFLQNNEDDAIDWTEGWNGTLSNAYVINNIAGFSTAVEADGVNGNPTLVNLTAISSTGGTAIQIKNDSGATINGLTLTGFETSFDFRDNAPASNLKIDGADADTAEDAVYASSSTNASLFSWATDAIGGNENELPSNITGQLVLDAGVTYTISGPVLVNNGASLTIPAGTEIISQSGTANYIAVLKGGSIDIQGTAGSPVQMRSDDGDAWGGLLICGDASTTEGVNAIAEVGGLVYGGTNDADNSGSIEYLILRNTGAQINADSQFNGLSLYGVGSETSISNVAVVEGADDGVEFFGGTVSVTNFYAENIEDDAVDWTEGWNGTLTNTYVINNITGFSTAIEADGVNGNPTLVNFTAISSTGGTAIQIKNDSGATINGLTMTGFSTSFDFRDNAPASNLQIDGADADTADDAVYASSSTNGSLFAWVTDTSAGETDALPSNITSDLTLNPSVQYTVSGPVLVNSGATLTIPAGTEIISQSGTANYIAVLKGGSINIEGESTNPVEMRSVDGNPWGGLLICGDASTTEGIDAIAEVGGLIYGGTNDEDNSGSIDYLILRNTGAQINADSQFNGLSLYAVGSGTTLTNIAVIGGADDGVEFYGGTVNLTNFYAENLEDDSVDWTEGWNGTLTNTFVNLSISGFSTAIEADGVNANPTLVNFTAVSATGGTAIQIKNNSGCTINGLSLSGFDTQFDFRDNAPTSNVLADGSNADETATYSTSTTVASDFTWATN